MTNLEMREWQAESIRQALERYELEEMSQWAEYIVIGGVR
jgi:hypothetical protein